MKLSGYFCRGITWSLLTLAFGLTLYRARTQPIAHDEALSYEWFLDQGVYHVLEFNTTNHALFSDTTVTRIDQ